MAGNVTVASLTLERDYEAGTEIVDVKENAAGRKGE